MVVAFVPRDRPQLPVVEHLLTIPGIGLLTATALFAFIGDVHRFPSGRHLASWLGLTPSEYRLLGAAL